MFKEAIFHQPYNNYAYPVDKDKLFVQIRVKKGEMKKVQILFGDRYDMGFGQNSPKYTMTMKKYDCDRLYDYYKIEIKLSTKKFKYFFLLDDGEEYLYYSMYGFNYEMPHTLGHFQYTYVCEADIYQTPNWVKNAIFYEIMVDRFNRGNTKETNENTLNWETIPKEPMQGEFDNFYGGDLEGIIKKLDYLKDMGITAVYLTPIFKSNSSHKYDVIDYMEIDSSFGDIDIFKNLLNEANKRGIKVILDFVFNHTSNLFFAFRDVLENGEKSRYKDWYFIKKFHVKSKEDFEEKIKNNKETGEQLPILDYETFADCNWNMPKIKLSNKEVKKYFLDVITYWVKDIGIDGLRLDVSDEMDHFFLEIIRKHIKEINPEVYIVGETFADAFPWLRGNELDGVTNYRFTYIITDFLTKSIDVNGLHDRLAYLRTTYPRLGQLSSLNLLGSHDMSRITNRLNYNINMHKLALVFQMTYIGVPIIYYGDEIGMIGDGVEQRRSPMIWKKEKRNEELFEFYKKIIKIRKENVALQKGEFELLGKEVGANIYSFIRKYEENIVIIIINNSRISTNLTIDLETLNIKNNKLIDLIYGIEYEMQELSVSFMIKAYETTILKVIN